MPNIELYGYRYEDAGPMREKIRGALETSADAVEIVTTTIPSDVEDLMGKKMPFLRIIATPKELPELKERLVPLGQDIEVILLGEWIPKGSKEPTDSKYWEMDAWEFFSTDRVHSFGVPHPLAVRISNCVKNDSWSRVGQEYKQRFKTMREFVALYSLKELRYIPNLGKKSIKGMVLVMRQSGLPLEGDKWKADWL